MSVQTLISIVQASHSPAFERSRRLFTVPEFHQMLQDGILREDDPVELIKGEILTMAPINARHARCVRQLIQVFNTRFGDLAVLDVQNPIWLDEQSEPQPDVVLLKPRDDLYVQHPTADDVLLLVEVCDTSLTYDREVKVPLDARAGVPELWLVNLVEARLDVYRDPTPQGYRERLSLWSGDTIAPLAFPECVCQINEIIV